MLLFACTIFTSAFLLFLVQPIVAKEILPWFGGSAAVWTTCLVFFQVALLAGYAYSDFTTRKLTPRAQALLHIALLAASLLVLPIIPDAGWKPAGDEDPGVRILGLLLITIGPPYFLLATTGPLVQAWFARAFALGTVYRLFALSNFASMLALISYPFAFEPWVTTAMQAKYWSIGYALFALLCAATALFSLRNANRAALAGGPSSAVPEDGPREPSRFDLILWLSLSAMGSWMLLAITNHITQNIASIPFLWLLPLTLYLLTFILCFESDGWYQRSWLLGPTAVMLGFCAWGLQTTDVTLDIKVAVPLYLTGLFMFCMFFHGELAKMRPAPRHLTRFYLMVSLGGALGGMFVGLVAPRIFPTYYELGLGFVVAAILATVTLRKLPFFVWIIPIALAGVCGFYWNKQIVQQKEDTRVMVRNFYGTLRTKDVGTASGEGTRRLIHGVILHGEQYLNPARHMELTTYYGPESGVGLAIKHTNQENQRVGVIGLGTGSLAAWGKTGDHYHFYDINPQVVAIAQTEFTYLKDSKAQVRISLGDARLSLEREAPHDFDVLAVDAFSSDSIPVHLITREAMTVYLHHVKPGGAIVFHVTNRFLKLAPVVKQIADELGLYTALIIDDAEDTSFSKTDWVIVTRDKTLIENPAIAQKSTAIDVIPGLRLWTDDFNNLFQILK